MMAAVGSVDGLSETPDPQSGESLDRLSSTLSVLQRQGGHRSATDDVLAAWMAWTAQPGASRVLDLGCGHGTVTLLLSQLFPLASFVSVEVQAVSASLARRNMVRNGLGSRVVVLEQDLRSLGAPADGGFFELATGTPPFMPMGSGLLSSDPQRAAARFELRGGIEDYCETAAKSLAEGGRISMLMDAAQDARCRKAFQENGLRLDRIVVVTPREGKAPRFRGYIGTRTSLVSARDAEIEQLVVRGSDGGYTEQMLEVRRVLQLTPVGETP